MFCPFHSFIYSFIHTFVPTNERTFIHSHSFISSAVHIQQSKKKKKKKKKRARDQQKQLTYAPSEDGDQLAHPPGLIKVVTVCIKKYWVLSYPLSTKWRL